MSDNTTVVEFELTLEDKQTLKKSKKSSGQLQILESSLKINDDRILSLIPEAINYNIIACNITLGANNTAVIIENYTLTNTISFSEFYNSPSNISIFQSKGIDVHIVHQRINHLQLDCQKLLLAGCQIEQLDIGLAEHVKASRNAENGALTAYKMKSVDIRECQIASAKAFVECDNISIQNSNIYTFSLYGDLGSATLAEVKRLSVNQYTVINVLEIYCKLMDFKVEKSTISNLFAMSRCLICKLDINNSTIVNAYNFEEESFQQHTFNAWLLIGKSAENNRDLNTKANAYFQMAKERYKKEKGLNKIMGSLFGFCTGYGYKPMRALFSCLILVVASFIILTIKNFIVNGVEAVKNLSDSATLSISAIAGQSGLSATNGFEFWIAMIEYIGGIVLFAMFVNALYVRYKD